MDGERIPRKIHYCWFGNNPKPELALKCIRSWKKFCPDYQIFEWNEDNFDISACPLYVQQAYEAKKWAFVSDYVRLKVIYDHGGIYLDTDVELIQSPDRLLAYQAYFSFEGNEYISTGPGFGAEKKCKLLLEIMKDYGNIPFVLEDGSYDLLPCPQRNTNAFLRIGLIKNGEKQILQDSILILSSDYLCPMDYYSGKITKSQNTISIHWYSASWQSEQQKQKHHRDMKQIRMNNSIHFIKTIPNRLLKSCLGPQRYNLLKNRIKKD